MKVIRLTLAEGRESCEVMKVVKVVKVAPS